eukprot:4963541-Pyramimonas_sp.AAC.1
MTRDLRSVASGRNAHSRRRNAATGRKHLPFIETCQAGATNSLSAPSQPDSRESLQRNQTFAYQTTARYDNSPLPGYPRNTARTDGPFS